MKIENIAQATGGVVVSVRHADIDPQLEKYLPKADGDDVNWNVLAKRDVFLYIQVNGFLRTVGGRAFPIGNHIKRLTTTDLPTTKMTRAVISESPDLSGKKISDIDVPEKQCLLLVTVENHSVQGGKPMRYRTLNVYSSRRGGNLDPNNLEDVCILKVQPINA